MFKRIAIVAPLLGVSLILLGTQVWAKDIAPSQASTSPVLQQEAGGVSVLLGASREGKTVTYAISLANTSASDVGDIFIASAVPSGTSFVSASAPSGWGWFRGVEAGSTVFLAERLPAWGVVGPFSYTVTLASDAPGTAWAWAHWRTPKDASAASAAVPVPGKTQPLPVDAVFGATAVFPQLPKGDWALAVLEVNFPPGTAINNASGEPPILFHQAEGWLSIQYPDGSSKITGPGSAFFEAKPHTVSVVGNAAVKGVGFALVPAGVQLPSPPPGIKPLKLSDKLTGLRTGPYVFALAQVRLHPGEPGWNHYHPGPSAAYVLEGTLRHTYAGVATTEGPTSVWFEYVNVPTDAFVVGDKVSRVVAALLFPADQPPAIGVQ